MKIVFAINFFDKYSTDSSDSLLGGGGNIVEADTTVVGGKVRT